MIIAYVVTVSKSLTLLRGQCAYLVSRGESVRLVSSPGPEIAPFAVRERIDIQSIEMSRKITPAKDLISLFRLFQVLRATRPDIVNASTPKGGLLGMIAAWLARTPVRVYVLRGLPLATARGPKRWLLWLTERIACRLSHRVICISPSLMDEVLRAGLCPATKMRVLGAGSSNGVDAIGRFNPNRLPGGARRRVREELSIPLAAMVLGVVGRIVNDKGWSELAEAWQKLRADFPTLHVLAVGDFEMQDPVSRFVDALIRSDERIHLVGEVEDVVPYFAAMDILAFPTYREGFGNVAIEANAMEIPVVATRVSGVVDAVKHGVTGTLVPPRDASALAAAIRAYLLDPEMRRSHGRAGRERVLREFRPETIWEALYAEYVRLLAAKGIPAKISEGRESEVVGGPA